VVITGEHPYRFVLHDRDSIYSTELDYALKSLGVIVLRTPFRAPQANSFCERLVGAIRRECLDFLIPLNQRHEKLGFFARFKALVLYLVPKIGPFSALAFHPPTPAVEQMYMHSFNESLDHYRLLERVKGYHDIARYPEARLIPGLVLFRWDAPLFFANAELFHERVLDAVANSPTPVRWLVVAAEPVTSVDVTAADAVCELDDTLHAAGIELCFAEMKDPVKDKLKRFGLFTRFGERTFFATLGEAVSAYRATHHVKWVDWEDRTS
jgi:anti-anti-sigma regulatory factor